MALYLEFDRIVRGPPKYQSHNFSGYSPFAISLRMP